MWHLTLEAGSLCLQACSFMTTKFVSILSNFGALDAILALIFARMAFLKIFGRHNSTGASDKVRKKKKGGKNG